MNVVFSYGKFKKEVDAKRMKAESQNINIRVYHGDFDFRRSIGQEISLKDWDFKKGELKLSGVSRTPEEHKYIQSLKEQLEDIKRAYDREFLELKLSHRLKSLNKTSWNEWCEITLNKGLGISEEDSQEAPYLIDKMNEYLEYQRTDFAPNTIKGYQSNLKVLKGFEGHIKHKFKTDEIDLVWYKALRDWNTEQGNNDNYFGSIIQKVKAVINHYRSVDKNFPYHPNIDHKKFQTIKQNPDHDILTEGEMELIYNYSGTGHLANVRDLMIIQYHACLRYDELKSELSKGKEALDIYQNDEGEYFWKILENKTGRKSKIRKVIPVHDRILNLYHSAKFPHIIQSQVYNRYTKELMTELGIDKTVTSHTLRRSFITNMFNLGIEENYIQQYSGHTDIRTMRKSYIKAKNVIRKNPIPTK